MKLLKHELNTYPNMSDEHREELKTSMLNNGFDPEFPVVLFEGKVIDGWQRYSVATELGIEPIIREFEGDDDEAWKYITTTNKRRSITILQHTAIQLSNPKIFGRFLSLKKSDGLSYACKTVADEFGVNESYVRHIDKATQIDTDVLNKIIEGHVNATELAHYVENTKQTTKFQKVAIDLTKTDMSPDAVKQVLRDHMITANSADVIKAIVKNAPDYIREIAIGSVTAQEAKEVAVEKTREATAIKKSKSVAKETLDMVTNLGLKAEAEERGDHESAKVYEQKAIEASKREVEERKKADASLDKLTQAKERRIEREEKQKALAEIQAQKEAIEIARKDAAQKALDGLQMDVLNTIPKGAIVWLPFEQQGGAMASQISRTNKVVLSKTNGTDLTFNEPAQWDVVVGPTHIIFNKEYTSKLEKTA